MWRPTAHIEQLQQQAKWLYAIRDYFHHEAVQEVITPQLSHHTINDPNIHSLSLNLGFHESPCYLQTSPEFHMKRLLAAGSGPIYQISHAFRDDEPSKKHNPEFTLLEWYRPCYDHHQLIDDMAQLLQHVFAITVIDKISYQTLLQTYLDVCPLEVSKKDLMQVVVHHHIDCNTEGLDKDSLLDLLMSYVVEPKLIKPTIVYDYPASQAALARLSDSDPRVAERFEFYWQGFEIANGFHELTDSTEQRQRFMQYQQQRSSLGLPTLSLDERFLASLDAMPAAAGVAVGLDRLFMAASQKATIHEVMTFPWFCA